MPIGIYIRTSEHKEKLSQAQIKRFSDPVEREKICQALLGKKNALGCHHHPTEEVKRKISQALLGGHLAKETRERMRQAHLGCPFTERHKEKLRQAMNRPEYREKIRQARLGNKNALGCHHTEEIREKKSLIMKEYFKSPKNREKQRQACSTPEHREKMRQATKRWWVNSSPAERDELVRSMRLGYQIKPNVPETLLTQLLENALPGEWKYIGDGQLIIDGKNPDFTNINGQKKLIELFGDYWHRGENPQDRIDIFKRYGYKTLVIWESELEVPEKVLERIDKFVKDLDHKGE